MTSTYFQPEPAFSEYFGKKPFLFSHNLDSNELFTTSSVEKLADIWSRDSDKKGFFYLDRKFREWGSEDHKASLVEAFRHSDLSRMRMKLSFIHTQPGYSQILETMTGELSQLTGVDLPKKYKSPMETLFLSSPNEFTPYHIDSEDSFLLQIQGTKAIYIFDGSDSEILNVRDIEKYWAQNQIDLRDEMAPHAICANQLIDAVLQQRDFDCFSFIGDNWRALRRSTPCRRTRCGSRFGCARGRGGRQCLGR